jgi:hypothetical protein
MAKTARERLARLLDDSATTGTFSARFLAPAHFLHLEVARNCADRLGAIIARPLRAEDDWSITWTGCGCDLCGTLRTFLGSRSRKRFEWPLAKDGRRHVHSQIDSAELTVRHDTRRQGRPYTLVLTKTDELFAREKDKRHQAMTDLEWLTSAWEGS